jgi:hypothetical protein
MAMETILQHWVISNFVLPFLLIFFILYGILEKTKALGENKQLNALVSLVVGLIFVGAISPKLVVENLILFFTVAIVVLFIALLLWGFASGQEAKLPDSKGLKAAVGAVIVLAVVGALLVVVGIEGAVFDFLFRQDWSGEFWTNAAFIAVIVIAVALMMKSGK